MHLVFERSSGQFKSNCNILALAWAPYYNESKFRSTLFDHHQRQLFNLSSSIAAGGNNAPASASESSNQQPASGHLAAAAIAARQSQEANSNLQANAAQSDGQRQEQAVILVNQFLNSRMAELHQRQLSLKASRQANSAFDQSCASKSQSVNITSELEDKYGLNPDFGWLVVGNVGRLVGVTLTSLVDRQPQRIGRDNSAGSQCNEDLMRFDDQCNGVVDGAVTRNQSKQTDDDPSRPDHCTSRANYNLRGHMDEVILVKWNELYQKLATVDSKGNVLIWCKVNDKFTIQTPFYNRTKSVADFKWSNDGKTALICYTDSFILVGSSSGQRHWHSMLNLDDYHITCASWTPNDEQLLLGVSNGNVVVIDLPHSELTELVVNQTNIRTMCWSSCELSLRSFNKCMSSTAPGSRRSSNTSNYRRNSAGTNVVNHRRLSRDCSVFSRYRFCSQGPQPAMQQGDTGLDNLPISNDFTNILAIDFANSTIKLYDGGLDDPKPKTIHVNQESYIMSWSSDGRILAVAGFTIHTTAPSIGCLRCRYVNSIKFYDQQGKPIYQYTMSHTRYPITAFTWAHNDQRIFVATGPHLHCARVYLGIPSLSLLASSCIQRNTKLPNKSDILDAIIHSNIAACSSNLARSWQSYNCPIKLDNSCCAPKLSSPKSSLLMLSLHDDDDGRKDIPATNESSVCNNSLVYLYHLPLKLKSKIDQLFRPTITQPYDERWSLNDIIWHVPRSEQRYYCTLVCYNSDRDIASSCYQYKTNPMDRVSDNQHHASDQAKIFVLYVEFQGSLIPILRARRVGFLKPEFVIFDPEDSQIRSQRQRKVSDISQQSQFLDGFIQRQLQANQQQQVDYSVAAQYYNESAGFSSHNCSDLHFYSGTNDTQVPGEATSMGRQSLSDAEHYYNFESDSMSGSQSRQACGQQQMKFADLVSGRSHHQEPIALPISSNPYLLYMMSLSVGHQQVQGNRQMPLMQLPSSSSKRQKARKLRVGGLKSCLTENNELIRIKSNIWGTKFKLINIGNHQIRHRSILGSVAYKTSILHLQPRQIFLGIKDMSNYCCLCSSHHHTKLSKHHPSTYNAIKNDNHLAKSSDKPNVTATSHSLLDMPNLGVAALITPVKSSKNSKKKAGERSHIAHEEKVLLQVGDGIRVAPKLEMNQRYRFGPHQPKPSTSSYNPGTSDLLGRNHRGKSRKLQGSLTASETHGATRRNNHEVLIGRGWPKEISTSNHNRSFTSLDNNNNTDDDVLTLSLGHGDQVRVEMSSLNSISQEPEPKAGPSREAGGGQKAIDEFLSTNKTLKSIQTITRMIVDLSSKADDIEEANAREQPSPSKIVKLSPEVGSNERSSSPFHDRVASNYVVPDTPVHRPRRVPGRHATGGIYFDQTQSATTTPLKSLNTTFSRHHLSKNSKTPANNGSGLPDSQLPAPPPSVPFGRRLSSSAKRFFDGSLRSLQGASNGYSTASNLELDESEPLVSGRPSSQIGAGSLQKDLRRRLMGLSQPMSPTNSRRPHVETGGKQASDFSSIRQMLVQRIRGDKSSSHQTPLSSGHKKSAWRYKPKDQACSSLDLSSSRLGTRDQSATGSSESASSDEDDDNYDFSDSELEIDAANSSAGNKLKKKAVDGKSKRLGTGCSASVKDLRESRLHGADGLRVEQPSRIKTSSGSSGRRRRRKSLCPSSNCCCAKEFKLKNRPPVWNEQSQVYQLDFGGRVTQESAKNLQIDFEGKLALQFGRIDRCTYTLDYKYPFNAVQAMAIALASLTQRLK